MRQQQFPGRKPRTQSFRSIQGNSPEVSECLFIPFRLLAGFTRDPGPRGTRCIASQGFPRPLFGGGRVPLGQRPPCLSQAVLDRRPREPDERERHDDRRQQQPNDSTANGAALESHAPPSIGEFDANLRTLDTLACLSEDFKTSDRFASNFEFRTIGAGLQPSGLLVGRLSEVFGGSSF
ncbi:MAG: hypothetical protein WD065_06775 [Planctomycetaceae bacterium]